MRRSIVVLSLALVLLVCLFGWSQVPAEDDVLLTALDEARFIDTTTTSLRVRVTSESGDETQQAELVLRFKEIDGLDYTRITFVAPADLAGQIYLATPNATYFYTPDLDTPIKTSASSTVFGDSAVAQTSGIRFASNYTISSRHDTTREDGSDALEIDLAAIDKTTAFQQITVVIDPETLRPITATLYALSGIPLYEVTYSAYATFGENDVYAQTQEILNLLLPDRRTTNEILDIGTDPLPNDLFDPNMLAASTAGD
jgi:outer membrane lipoprotein-sorting protein